MKTTFIFLCSGMFRDVPACSGMFHVPGFIDARFPPTTYLFYVIVFKCSLKLGNIQSSSEQKFGCFSLAAIMNFQLITKVSHVVW